MARFLPLSVLILCAIVTLGGFALWLSLDPGPAEPNRDDWNSARSVIQNLYEPGDGIRVHPFWLREAAAVLGKINNNGQSPELIDFSLPPDPMFVARHKRLWIVSAMERTDLPVPRGGKQDFHKSLSGGVEVRRYTIPPDPGFVDLLSLLPKAKVMRWVGNGKRRTCTWNGHKHRCRGRSREDVKVELKEVGGSPRRCVILHPYPDRGTVVLTFDNVAMKAGVLIRSGLTLEAARRKNGSSTRIVVRVDGKKVHSRVEPRNGWDWNSTWIDTAHLNGKRAAVAIEVKADQEEWRELCVDGYVLSAEPATLQR